jgi:hypothetical protein
MVIKGKPLKLRNAITSVIFSSDKKATIANMSINLGGQVFVATGSSWRNSGDPYDEYKGSVIALYRAVEELKDVIKTEVDKLEA